jgi:hypothetical protein
MGQRAAAARRSEPHSAVPCGSVSQCAARHRPRRVIAAPKDQKCDNCRLRKGACQFAARIAAGHALPSPDEPSTSKPRPTQPVADSDMDIDRPNTRPSRQCQPPERFECDEELQSFATGKRRTKSTCCSCSETTTSAAGARYSTTRLSSSRGSSERPRASCSSRCSSQRR